MSSSPSPGETPPAGADTTGEQLLRSLQAYIDSRLDKAPAERAGAPSPVMYNVSDRIWIGVLFVALTLLGMLIPDQLFKDPRYKTYFGQLLALASAAGLFSRWVTSPRDLLALSRRLPVRAMAATLLGVCFLLIVNIVKVDATLQPGTTLVVKDGPQGETSFWTRLKPLEVEVKPTDGGPARPFTLSPWQLLKAGLHPRPDWRLLHRVALQCLGCPSGENAVRARLKDGSFDPEVQRDLKNDRVTIEADGAALIALPRTHEVQLPAGTYSLELVLNGATLRSCPLEPLTVRTSPTTYSFGVC